jgi:hypothetical protein
MPHTASHLDELRLKSYHLLGREQNAPRLFPGALHTSKAPDSALHSHSYYCTMPRKISVLPNVVGHWLITLGLGPVPARKASTAAHVEALRESVHTA